jgi:hypothetical protein
MNCNEKSRQSQAFEAISPKQCHSMFFCFIFHCAVFSHTDMSEEEKEEKEEKEEEAAG